MRLSCFYLGLKEIMYIILFLTTNISKEAKKIYDQYGLAFKLKRVYDKLYP